MIPRLTIEAFDRHLASLGLRFEGVVIGGSALVPWLEQQEGSDEWPA